MTTSVILTYWTRHTRPTQKHASYDLRSLTKIFHFPIILSLLVLSTGLFGLLFTIHPAFLNEQGIEISAILILYAIYGVLRMLSMLLVPRIHDHAPIALTACAVMITVALAIFIVETSYFYVVIAMVLLGIGISIIYPMYLEAILSRTDRRIHNKIIGSFAAVVGVGWDFFLTGTLFRFRLHLPHTLPHIKPAQSMCIESDTSSICRGIT